MLASLRHKNIVKLYEVFESDNHLYLVLELLKGRSLNHVLSKRRDFPEKMVSKFCKKLLSAILYMHQKGVTHRDIKPDNIVFKDKNKNNELSDFALVDFGLSTTSKT